ncbi:MAG: serine/threonine protein kinase [Lentisphaeria bacterium]|nr:serine/threonine protein kinase [Lentisphaeria bacterium]
MNDRHQEDNPEYTVPEPVGPDAELPENFRLPSDTDGGMFQDLKLLGMGGMGVVYEADDPALERKVALKMLRSKYRGNGALVGKFIQEARITAKIDHPNIVAVHRLGMHPECGAYFSMRRIKGETLQTVLRHLREGDPGTRRRYTLRRLLNIFIAGCNGVAAAHAKRILHCDLKPSNIMIGEIGAVWVLDWGVAREMDEPPAAPRAENASGGGTPAFMAPELVTGRQAAPDEKTEVYALGAILHCILTWRDAPFDLTRSRDELLRAAAAGKLLPLRAPEKNQVLQVELTAICRKAMHPDRDRRYSDVNALLEDLHNYMDGRPVSAYSPNPLYRLLKLCRRRPLIPSVTTVALAMLAVYHLGSAALNYAEDRLRLRQAHFNLRMADEHVRQAMRQWHTLTSAESGLTPLNTVLTERGMMLSANLAMMEGFAAFDAAAGASPGAARAFAENSGAKICKQLLRLQILTAAPDAVRAAVDRFQRRWNPLFQICRRDPELDRMVNRVLNGTGTLLLNGDDPDAIQRCTLIRPDGSSEPLVFRDRRLLELPAGDTRVHFTRPDGSALAAFFRIPPGASAMLTLPPPPPEPGWVTVPDDHWFVPVSGIGEKLQRLPEFRISASEISGGEFMRTLSGLPEEARSKLTVRPVLDKVLVCPRGAEIFCREFGRLHRAAVRLPDESELLKSLTPGAVPGHSFYGANDPSPDIPLFVRRRNGGIAVFNPVTRKIIPARADSAAGLRVVWEIR